jgi:hypothetical protein
VSSRGSSDGRRALESAGEEADRAAGFLVWNGLVMRAERTGSALVARSEPAAEENEDGERR